MFGSVGVKWSAIGNFTVLLIFQSAYETKIPLVVQIVAK